MSQIAEVRVLLLSHSRYQPFVLNLHLLRVQTRLMDVDVSGVDYVVLAIVNMEEKASNRVDVFPDKVTGVLLRLIPITVCLPLPL